jgi:hypothetical protein
MEKVGRFACFYPTSQYAPSEGYSRQTTRSGARLCCLEDNGILLVN